MAQSLSQLKAKIESYLQARFNDAKVKGLHLIDGGNGILMPQSREVVNEDTGEVETKT